MLAPTAKMLPFYDGVKKNLAILQQLRRAGVISIENANNDKRRSNCILPEALPPDI